MIMRSKSIIYAAGTASAGILCTSFCRIRIATAFSPLSGGLNYHANSKILLLRASKTSSEVADQSKRTKPFTPSKFAALMAGEVSSPSSGFDSIRWDDEYDNASIVRRRGGGGDDVVHTAVLPDDEAPPNSSSILPSLHNRRALYYHPSLLTKDESSSLQKAAEASGLFEEFDSRCAVVIEDGMYQDQDKDTVSTGNAPSSSTIASLLRPILDTTIVPWAREICNAPSLAIADALIRSYDPAEERQDLATHYDNTAYATVVVALNDPTEYEGGLFVQTGANVNTRKSVPFSSPGDAVLHRFDVQHGVNVRSGKKKRFSLVIWFGEDEDSVVTKTVPWVRREAEECASVHAAFLYAVNSQSGLYGVDTNVQLAKDYYVWASDRGHGLSAYCLSNLLFKEACSNDISTEEQNTLQEQSLMYLKLSAERGLAHAQHELGVTYKQGYSGVQSDFEIARYWLMLAEKQGHGASSQILNDPSRWEVSHL
eukprot:scaffold26440_cov161-Skeletonema_marinoi.AAC.1